MNVFKSGPFGLVLDNRDPTIVTIPSRRRGSLVTNRNSELCGHFILDQYTIDHDGYICFTPRVPMHELDSMAVLLKAELVGLLQQARQKYFDTLPYHRVVL